MTIEADWLNELLGEKHPTETLVDALEQMGCDVEDVVQMDRYRCPTCQVLIEASLGADVTRVCPTCGYESDESFEKAGSMTAIRLDLLAARPDLFDVGGISRALKGFLGQETGLPQYTVGRIARRVVVDPSVGDPESYRPYIRCAVVVVPPLTEASLISLMNLQEALHWGVGRARKLASIGVYNLDAIQDGDIHYRTMDPDKERFVPLGMPGKPMSGRQILQEHPKGKAYAGLLEESKRYPLLIDSADQVLSMPPIINSDATRIEMGASRLFIDVTGPSEAAVVRSLDTLVCSLVELGGQVEQVEIVEPASKSVSPDLAPRDLEVELESAKKWLGIPLDAAELQTSLRKMRLDVAPVPKKPDRFKVTYPALRTDIKHMVDVFEDLAIGYGYRRIEAQQVRTMTAGKARSEEDVSGLVRDVMTGLGYLEIMSMPITTEQDHFEKFRLPVPDAYTRIANPKLKAMKVIRSHLMTGLLEALQKNRRHPMPLRMFEVDNIVLLDDQYETGAREERHVALVEMGEEAGYASIRSAVDALLFELGAPAEYEVVEHASFIDGRVASVNRDDTFRGHLGELHPEVLIGFGLEYPVALAEIVVSRVAFDE